MSFSILVVDDEPDVVDLFRQHFRYEMRTGDYVIHFAESGDEAIRKLKNCIEGPNLILSDINMPGLDGMRLLQEVKSNWPHIPVFIVTAYGDENHRREASLYEAGDFLTKPINFDYLKQRVGDVIRNRSSE